MNKVPAMEGTRREASAFGFVARRRSWEKETRHAVSRENHRTVFPSPRGCGLALGRDLQGFWIFLDLHYITCPCHSVPALPLP